MSNQITAGSIVVGIDGSEHAARAVRWAAEQAALEQRPLVVVAAARFTSVHKVGWTETLDGPHPTTHQILVGVRALTEDAARDAIVTAPGITVDQLAVLGDPRQVLVDISSRAHLVVVGARGRSTFRGMPLGSVSTALSRGAACPMVVSRPPADEATHGVLVGADGTPESLPVVEFAFEQASLRGLPVTVAHSFCDVVAAARELPGLCGVAIDESYLDALRVMLSASVAGLQEKYPDVHATLTLRHGLVDEVLGPRRRSWDLVAVGQQPSHRGETLLGAPISTAVIERSRCDVAVVPHGGIRT